MCGPILRHQQQQQQCSLLSFSARSLAMSLSAMYSPPPASIGGFENNFVTLIQSLIIVAHARAAGGLFQVNNVVVVVT